ncbi:insulin-like growth factor I [Polistes fuscatus]|uniref:insulin-like growth factor I n=1 Tax=Polistes fuscatus TaxID=30207 RepID=UPI001CA99C10|nr:insulin-like growth factor I [Polistes fuscatus]
MTSRKYWSTTRIHGFGFGIGTIALTIFLIINLFGTINSAPFERSNMRTLRLCSRRLSDALYLVCSDRGYNEPFSYSSEDEQRGPTGPGLVEECCYHSCSYVQLEQYCKQKSEKKRGGSRDNIKSIRIVNLPDSFLEIHTLSKEEKPYHHKKKGKDCRTKTGRKQGHGDCY